MTTQAPSAPVKDLWLAAWPEALRKWSDYTQLREPEYYGKPGKAAPREMRGEIAAIRLTDQTVMVNLDTVREKQLAEFALPIQAHEIGHHVFVPGNLTDNARMIAAMKPMLEGLSKDTAGMLGNLYGDLQINDRLQRGGVDIAGVYRRLKFVDGGAATTRVWNVYAKTYEYLWGKDGAGIAPEGVKKDEDEAARIVSGLVRTFSRNNWLRGARRFAAIMYPFLVEDAKDKRAQTFRKLGLEDTVDAGEGAIPDGLTDIDPDELGDEDWEDEALNPLDEEREERRKRKHRVRDAANTAPEKEGIGAPGRQFREPFEYGELLKALGLNLSKHEVTTRYYRERAMPHLIPFPEKKAPQGKEPLAEGYEPWDSGEDVGKLDVFGSVLLSPRVIPGVTTVQRVYGESPGSDPAKVPLDLDIYIDCSGSMPDPAVSVSYLALAGTILALSALRAGAKVQATLWSGAGQFETTEGFVRDENRILGIVTGYISGGTAFPIHVLRETYASRKKTDPPAHIVVISDDGVTTMLDRDEKAISGEKIATQALQAARGGGTLVLNVPESWRSKLRMEKLGFRVYAVMNWEELVKFAREFVRENYQEK